MALKATEALDLMLVGEGTVPQVAHAKQFDRKRRLIKCSLYEGSVPYTVPDGAILSVTGTRPDGMMFQYSSETAPDYVYQEDGAVMVTVTAFMSEKYGRFPVDVTLLDDDGGALGTFCFTLKVERSAAFGNGRVATLTYAGLAQAVLDGLVNVYLTEDGCIAISSEDGMGFEEGYELSTVAAAEERMLNANVGSDGLLVLTTDGAVGLSFSMDGEGKLYATVEY